MTEQAKRVLYLTKDPKLIERQLAGEDLLNVAVEDLLDRVSTDTYPTKACFSFEPAYMASKALTGLKLSDGWVPDNAVRNGNFGVVRAGRMFGSGSSREQFPASLKEAGIELIVTESMERICARNCINIGLPYLEQGQNETTSQLDRASADILRAGGLFPFLIANPDLGKYTQAENSQRAMTAPEKILAAHMGLNFVKPGEQGFANADNRYAHEIFFPYAFHGMKNALPDSQIFDKSSVYLFYDHSTQYGSREAELLASEMRSIAFSEGLKLYDGDKKRGAQGIFNILMIDNHALPSELSFGTDSHTSMIGGVGALAFGIGATEWAGSLLSGKVRMSVPPTVRFELIGQPPAGVMAKDIMLYILSQPFIRNGQGVGSIFEFTGSALENQLFDEQLVYPNMSVEGSASTGFISPNARTLEFLERRRNLSQEALYKMAVKSDPNAEYLQDFVINTQQLEPFVALPGDPRNGVPLSQVIEDSSIDRKIQKAYVGSCTGSKYEDLRVVAEVLEGRQIHPDVKLYAQASSREVFARAKRAGLIKIILDAGGIITPPGCNACVNFGPGSIDKGEQGVSTTNRNFPGRMGQGDVFLANPAVVAASAIAGQITSPARL